MKIGLSIQSPFLLKIILLGILSMTTMDVSANSNSDVMDPKYQVAEKVAAPPWESMDLVGKGKLSVLFWDIYNAELYTSDGAYQKAQFPIALRLVYLRDFKKKDLISETQKQWEKLGFKDKAKTAIWVARLEELWRDVEKHESITLYIDASSSSFFYFDNEQLGQVEDPNFAQAFLDIWLSENTSAPDVRKKLIADSKVERTY